MNSQFTAQTRVLHVGKVSAGSLQVLVLDKRVEVQILSSALANGGSGGGTVVPKDSASLK